MAAEYDDLPEAVKKEVQTFADVNVAWLSRVLSAAAVVSSEESEPRARAIFSAVAGAQLIARSRSNISLYALIDSYRVAGLLPAKTVQSSITNARHKGRASRRPVAAARR
jgi:TetR/AcrR family transcriptional repressor of nem operon